MVLDIEFLLGKWSGVSFLLLLCVCVFFGGGWGGEKGGILDNTKFLSVRISSCSHDSGFNSCCIVRVFMQTQPFPLPNCDKTQHMKVAFVIY